MLKKANQKRRLDDLIMQEGDFSTDYLAKADLRDMLGEDIVSTLDKINGLSTQDEDDAANDQRIQEALAAAEDDEDAEAARAAYADVELDAPDFDVDEGQTHAPTDRDIRGQSFEEEGTPEPEAEQDREEKADDDEDEEEEEEGGAIDDYLLDYVDHEWNDYFSLWKAKRI
jgi:helicase SWR1